MNTRHRAALPAYKKLGQHFLQDPNILRKIIASCQLTKTDHVLEIGPGLGALTREIAPKVQSLYAIEKDPRMTRHLLGQPFINPKTFILRDDFLKFNLRDLPRPIKVIGNLPYNISSPIIEKLFAHRDWIQEAFVMVQLEFGQRLVAYKNQSSYSALSCVTRFYADPSILFLIPPGAFTPRPNVESCFVRLRFNPQGLPAVKNEHLFRAIVKSAFQQRRKQLVNALAALGSKHTTTTFLSQAKIDPQQRAENLSMEDYVRLSNILADQMTTG